MKFYSEGLFVIIVFMFVACTNKEHPKPSTSTLFNALTSRESGIDFVNQLDYTEKLNTYTYKNFYNGGGVGLGDFNNDSLVDIFFAGNMVPNKLYVNKGNLSFRDISETAGVSMKGVWTTGVSLADVNADGWLDIYLCKSGPPGGEKRYNELFINNGDLTFTEKSKQYGLAFEGLSTHAAFFDFDKDDDLDCYLLNNSIRSVGGYDLRVNQRNLPDPLGGNKLLRNDDGKFSDVSAKAGIYSSEIGFGLGVTIGDLNKDGWSDIYVSNDFFEKDYLYINMQDGTFRESLEEYIQEISLGSMGADMADINNDGLPEIFVTEMLPEYDDRLKTTTQFESWDKYNLNQKAGYFRQFSRNVLQLNNGNGTFSEIGRLAGVHATDWSWGALIFDMDNDGFKDIFVANGIYKELLNQDYVNFTANQDFVREVLNRKKGLITQLIDSIPSTPISNYAFRNNGNLSFTNKATEWGLGLPTFSNGSAYGDLDNDGDLDLVLNNVNMPSLLYENRSKQLAPENATISFGLHGGPGNSFALGTKITVKTKEGFIYQELSPMRGFMSTVDNRIHIGLGKAPSVDSIFVEWPNDKMTILSNVKSNQFIDLYQKDAAGEKKLPPRKKVKPVFKNIPELKGVDFEHLENDFVDFDRDRLLFNMISNEGPCLCTGDVNQDGLFDFYVGGAKDQPGALFAQQKSGTFLRVNENLFEKDKGSEDTDCIFFDANGDGMLDLYVTSGGAEFSSSSPALIDRLYFSLGKGKMEKSSQLLPVLTKFESTSTVIANDYDRDGDIDLFVGARLIPFSYGTPANGYVLNNDGKGNFRDVTKSIAPELLNLGLITDAKWIDANNDSLADLLVVGEWMSIKIFIQENGKLIDKSTAYGLKDTNGWFNVLETADFNKDGFVDFVAGNHGLNSRFKASKTEPVSLYVNDFDQNGTIEGITTRYDRQISYPLVLKQDLISQIPSLKKKYLHFRDYKEKTIADIFTEDQLKNALVLHAKDFETSVWMNNGNGTFSKHTLPLEVQFSPVYAILIDDFNKDGNLDILLGGNLYKAKPETGIYGGGHGILVKGNGAGNFQSASAAESGLNIVGEIRSLKKIKNNGRTIVIVGKNNSEMQFLTY
jgi:hypothetical protein